MSEPIRALLAGAVDYAGLFPPAQLTMRDAVERYAKYRTSPHAWMLGRFVVPASRLAELVEAVPETQKSGRAWLLSVLVDEPARDLAVVAAFNREHTWAQCDVIEVRAASEAAVDVIAAAVRGTTLRAYVEVRIDSDPGYLIKAIADTGLSAKVRTGGIAESAIPSSSQIARFLSRCVRAHVRFKATAGLHHPVRGEYRLTYEADSATAVMFGYLNVFLAAALLHSGGSEQDAVTLLEARDVTSLSVDATGIHWVGLFIPATAIATLRRDALAGFGSCSFTEPVDEIVALGFA